jgi:hypothetical protein
MLDDAWPSCLQRHLASWRIRSPECACVGFVKDNPNLSFSNGERLIVLSEGRMFDMGSHSKDCEKFRRLFYETWASIPDTNTWRWTITWVNKGES